MTTALEVDVWIRGSPYARTHRIVSVPADPGAWQDADVRQLLTECLRALHRENDPSSEPPPVTLRGFSWVVSPYDEGGVVLHLEMQLGTTSAGPFEIGEQRLTDMILRVMTPTESAPRVH